VVESAEVAHHPLAALVQVSDAEAPRDIEAATDLRVIVDQAAQTRLLPGTLLRRDWNSVRLGRSQATDRGDVREVRPVLAASRKVLGWQLQDKESESG
jgi:hypothetical protein